MADTKNFEAKAFTSSGTSRDTVALPSTLFDGTVHMPAMHQAVTQLAHFPIGHFHR